MTFLYRLPNTKRVPTDVKIDAVRQNYQTSYENFREKFRLDEDLQTINDKILRDDYGDSDLLKLTLSLFLHKRTYNILYNEYKNISNTHESDFRIKTLKGIY